jgi:hypothetical protein
MSAGPKDPTKDPRLIAGVEMLKRTGARSFQIRYSDDEQPVVWMAVAEYSLGPNGRPVARGGRQTFEAAGAMDPINAVLRLLDHVVDGGYCTHCDRPTGVTDHWESSMPLADAVCWYQYDPETQRFRRGCEGDT